ncbi:MAG TPA: zinc-ribbon domain containing protein [Desulfosporosinus sp.]|nr:zinc-ribbon domain containing protein [Desulfosporosinus sp.]
MIQLYYCKLVQITASEQEFYAEKGFTNEPERCHECYQPRTRSNW